MRRIEGILTLALLAAVATAAAAMEPSPAQEPKPEEPFAFAEDRVTFAFLVKL